MLVRHARELRRGAELTELEQSTFDTVYAAAQLLNTEHPGWTWVSDYDLRLLLDLLVRLLEE